tara:strand:+ start:1589 stop:1816 length:228 start_codon:yes stop_codon:yes gene_type:complete
MPKKRAYSMIERVLQEAKGEWLPAHEIMVRTNLLIPTRSSIMVGAASHWLKVLISRNQVEKWMKTKKLSLYRWKK